MASLQADVKQALERLSALMAAADPAIAAQFDPAAEVLLVGSEVGEVVRGHQALGRFFAEIFALPLRIKWVWDDIEAGAQGETVWFFAEGAAVVLRDGIETRRPYRLSGVLVRTADGLRWRQFHGAEPKP